jgi:predicted dehydrogenase
VVSGTGQVGVAVVGAGVISNEYLTNLVRCPDVNVLVVADALVDRARQRAEEFGVPDHGDLGAALGHPEVEIVVNLTIPAAHVEVSTAALEAGKHVYTEKPFALDRDSGAGLVALARERELRIGSAPDTFLGSGLQLAQQIIRRGDIGAPVSALTIIQNPGPESWHPNPDFLFAAGAGPLWDFGPYYVSMLTQLLGSVRSVAATSTTAVRQRQVWTGPRAGEVFDVLVPTNVGVLMRLDGDRMVQSTYSFESSLPRPGLVEITGTEATMAVPDPNRYDGDVYVYPLSRRFTEAAEGPPPDVDRSTWVKHEGSSKVATRGTSVVEMARAIRSGEPHRASAELGYHVLDTLSAIDESLAGHCFVDVSSEAPIAAPLPPGWSPFDATL